MRKITPALCLVLSTLIAYGQGKKEIKKLRRERDEFVNSGTVQQEPFTKTIHFRNVKGLIVISVTIDGKVYNFLFDSGAPTTISDQLAKSLNLESLGTSDINDGTSKTQSLNRYMIKELAIGGIRFNNTGCMAVDLGNINRAICETIDGIIGANLMHECFWKLAFADSTLHLYSALPAIPAGAKTIPFTENYNGSPMLSMRYEDSSLSVELDCGANVPLTIAEDISALPPRKRQSFASGYGATVQTFSQKIVSRRYAGIADSIMMGDALFSRKLVYLSKERKFSILGNSFLQNYETYLDWKNHKVYLNQVSDAIDTKISRSFGFSPTPDSNKFKVVFLWNGSPADKAGIRIGDQVMSFNGINTSVMSDGLYCDIVRNYYDLEQLKLVIRDETGIERTITLDKYDLVK